MHLSAQAQSSTRCLRFLLPYLHSVLLQKHHKYVCLTTCICGSVKFLLYLLHHKGKVGVIYFGTNYNRMALISFVLFSIILKF
ncbi:Uncharacterized protein APZ42_024170 [Daphnia magna]|uniref:Uncharacterized protein n=1 Tax=Daphnia magna TaxID=35525 RepID=A0A164UIY1_9CRUS|nr:Uncharacterized protein APZ42_024170 [Daphnia magna]